MFNLTGLVQPLLMRMDPEQAHRLTLAALKSLPLPRSCPDDALLAVEAFGLKFPNPVGIAAGFDKNAEVPDAMLRLGFGHIEVGGVTPLAQKGNPAPRVFRLAADRAVINRLGFNNEGLAVMRGRLEARKAAGAGGIVGVNLGSNKDTVDRAADFTTLVEGLSGVADYFTVNVSSPNTPGLRDLQGEAALDALLGRVMDTRAALVAAGGMQRPILLKIAPDITLDDLDGICAVVLKHNLDGMVVSNTLVARPDLKESDLAKEIGGLSGRPVFSRSTALLGAAFERVGSKIPLIGVGGVDSGAAAWAKIRAGASLVQLYTGLIYGGLPLLGEMKDTIRQQLKAGAYANVQAAVGRDAADWAKKA